MLNRRLTGIFAVVAIAFVSGFALAQEKPADKDKGAPPAAGGMDPAAMQAMMEGMKPGPHHKELEAMAGKFKYVNKFKMDPSQDWTTAEGEYEGEMIMDGRYLTFTVKGPMMGSEFVGMGCLGYDNNLGKHVSAWIDNMGTGIMRSEGTCSADHKTITFEGKELDSMTKKVQPYKYTYELKSADEYAMHWWTPGPDGKMFESMTIEYKRVK